MGMRDTCAILGFLLKIIGEEWEQGLMISLSIGKAPRNPVLRQKGILQLEGMEEVTNIF